MNSTERGRVEVVSTAFVCSFARSFICSLIRLFVRLLVCLLLIVRLTEPGSDSG